MLNKTSRPATIVVSIILIIFIASLAPLTGKLYNRLTEQLCPSTSAQSESVFLVKHENNVNSVAFSPDGKIIASGSEDQTVKLWDAENGKLILTLIGHVKGAALVAFSPDGKMIASGSYEDKKVRLWDVQTGAMKQELSLGNQRAEAFSADGKTMACTEGDFSLQLWDLNLGKAARKFTSNYSIIGVALSTDGTIVAAGTATIIWSQASIGTGGGRLPMLPGEIKVWNVQTGKSIRTLKGHKSGINCISFSPDNKIIASGSFDQTVKLWDVQTGKAILTLTGHSDVVTSVTFSLDGKLIASGGWDNIINIYDISTGTLVRSLKGHSDKVRSIAFSPDGKAIASGSNDKTLRLWRVN